MGEFCEGQTTLTDISAVASYMLCRDFKKLKHTKKIVCTTTTIAWLREKALN